MSGGVELSLCGMCSAFVRSCIDLVSSEIIITWDARQGRGDLDQPGLSPTATLLSPPPESLTLEQAVEFVRLCIQVRKSLTEWVLCQALPPVEDGTLLSIQLCRHML